MKIVKIEAHAQRPFSDPNGNAGTKEMLVAPAEKGAAPGSATLDLSPDGGWVIATGTVRQVWIPREAVRGMVVIPDRVAVKKVS